MIQSSLQWHYVYTKFRDDVITNDVRLYAYNN
jgi:hypothetical protein